MRITILEDLRHLRVTMLKILIDHIQQLKKMQSNLIQGFRTNRMIETIEE